MNFVQNRHKTFAVSVLLLASFSDFNCARDFVIDQAAEVLGGKTALRNLQTLSYQTQGKVDALNESLFPGDQTQSDVFSDFTLDAKQDILAQNLRLDYSRRINLFNVTIPIGEIIQGNLGVFTGVNVFGIPLKEMTSDHVLSSIRQQRLLFPHLLLQKVLENPSLVSKFGTKFIDGSFLHFLEIEDEVRPITLFLNKSTGLFVKAETFESDVMIRDTKLEVFYDDWRTVGSDLLFHHQVSMRFNGFLVRQEERSSIQINQLFQNDTFEFPENLEPVFDLVLAEKGKRGGQYHQMFHGLAFQDGFVGSPVIPIELAPGVFHLTGVIHHSMAIEQENRVILVEGPAFDERTQAILEWASIQFPTKPITHVISTHHHMDHSGGLRAFVANGASIVVAELVEDFFRNEVFGATSDILPDLLAQNPNSPSVLGVEQDGVLTIDDPIRPVTAFQVPSGHAADMLIIYLPNEQILFTSDLFSPGAPVGTGLATELAADLDAAINTLAIPISAIVGGHGFGTATVDEFRATFGF